jgi:organic radical activating enzyme
MINKKESYTSASTFPIKLLHNKVVENNKIIPLHIQLLPTNACNLNCSFCSCEDRDKKKKLELEQIVNIIDICRRHGTKAITITGGGEPLMYKEINEVINYANEGQIQVGLVTNGILLDKLNMHHNLTWCRISSSDDRIPVYNTIEKALKVNPKTNWAFSHVVTKQPNYITIKNLIEFANKKRFSHIRLVSDLLDLDNTNMKGVVAEMTYNNVDDSRVIYQDRKESTRGVKDCYISLLKPVITPEGIFPCCGAQYALNNEKHDMINKMKMGDIKDLDYILNNQKHFNGSKCDVCYYSQYNDALSKIKSKVEHKNFV